jgi:thiamine transport system substrate-binding protein
LSRALKEEIFEEYDSPLLGEIPDQFELDGEHRALPVDFGDVCLNYDTAFLQNRNIPPPQSLDDLISPEYKGLLVVQNPATSSPGLAFLLVTIAHYGEEGFLEYWKNLVDNDVLVVNSWESAYYTEFSGSSGQGPRPIVVSYSSSPVFEMIFAEKAMSEPPTAAVISPGTCFRQIEFVGILKGAQNPGMAEKWVDYMLSTRFQEDVPMQMFVFPVNQSVVLDDTFKRYMPVPELTAEISTEAIAQSRENWLNAWTETVLR